MERPLDYIVEGDSVKECDIRKNMVVKCVNDVSKNLYSTL